MTGVQEYFLTGVHEYIFFYAQQKLMENLWAFVLKIRFFIILNPIFLSLGDEGDACQSKNFERSDQEHDDGSAYRPQNLTKI